MSFKLIFRIQGLLLIFLAAAMIVPPLVGIAYGEDVLFSFAPALCITFLSGILLLLICPASNKIISHREGFVIVSLAWILATFFGCLPFIFNNTFPTFSDAYFETVSGFTTTGATVLHDIEILPKSILFWRSMIQWLGGMGIILFSIAILPLLGIGGMQLYKAEVPGPVVEKLKPRIAETARSLWKVYVLLSLVQTLLLVLCGMDLFDAVCHTFTTMATGGFSTKNNSIEYFNNPYIEIICILFMFSAGMNFSHHYRILFGNIKKTLKDPEFTFYVVIVTGSILMLTGSLYGNGDYGFLFSVRKAAFQAVSIMTTTGYSTADFSVWPFFAQILLLLLMFVGGCAGSTGGGIKCIRILLLLKRCYRELFSLIHPHAVSTVKIGSRSVPETILKSVLGFMLLYIMLFIVGTLCVSLCGIDIVTSFSCVAACLGNIGPGLGAVGPYENYHFIPFAGKWILIAMMLLGRLEIYTLFILFVPEFWKK